MELFSSKKINYLNIFIVLVNIALIILGIIKTKIASINGFLIIVALLSGLVYIFKNYKKEAARYYKSFMILYTATTFLDLIAFLLYSKNIPVFNTFVYIVVCARTVTLACTALLTFILNLGKENSFVLAKVILFINIALFIVSLFNNTHIGEFIMSFSYLLLSLVAYSFVNQKYINKQSREAK